MNWFYLVNIYAILYFITGWKIIGSQIECPTEFCWFCSWKIHMFFSVKCLNVFYWIAWQVIWWQGRSLLDMGEWFGIDTLEPEQKSHGHHCMDSIFKYCFTQNFGIFIQISLNFVFKGIDNKSTISIAPGNGLALNVDQDLITIWCQWHK